MWAVSGVVRRGIFIFIGALMWALFAVAGSAAAQNAVSVNGDVRTAAMGDTGAAVTGDALSVYGNAASTLFEYRRLQMQFTYTPYRPSEVSHTDLMTLGGYVNVNRRHAVLFGGRLFREPKIEAAADGGKRARPNMKSLDVAYSYRLHQNFSVALASGYYHRADGHGSSVSFNNFAASVFASFTVYDLAEGAKVNVGATVSNFGFSLKGSRFDLPLSVRGGASLYVPLNNIHLLEAAVEAGYAERSGGRRDEYTLHAGLEYSLYHSFMFRAGYLRSDFDYFTVGAGVRFLNLQLDASYRVGTGRSPWRHSFGIGAGVQF